MRIRREQQEVLSRYVTEQYVHGVMLHIRKFWPEKCIAMGEVAVRDSIYRAIEHMRVVGVTSKFQIVRFLNLMYEFDWDLDGGSFPDKVSKILEDNELGGQQKIDRIYALVDPEFVATDEGEDDEDDEGEDDEDDEGEDDEDDEGEDDEDDEDDEEFLDDSEYTDEADR